VEAPGPQHGRAEAFRRYPGRVTPYIKCPPYGVAYLRKDPENTQKKERVE